MSYPEVHARPETCHICKTSGIMPRQVIIKEGNTLVTHLHWVCPRCSSRIKQGVKKV
jgi:hypothetical protein